MSQKVNFDAKRAAFFKAVHEAAIKAANLQRYMAAKAEFESLREVNDTTENLRRHLERNDPDSYKGYAA